MKLGTSTAVGGFIITVFMAASALAQSINGELGPMPEVKDPKQFHADTVEARRIADSGAGTRYCMVGDKGASMRVYMDLKTRITYLYPGKGGVESPLPERGFTYTLKKLTITQEMLKRFGQFGVKGQFVDEGRVVDFISQENGQLFHTAIVMMFSADGSNTAVAFADPINYTFFIGTTEACK